MDEPEDRQSGLPRHYTARGALPSYGKPVRDPVGQLAEMSDDPNEQARVAQRLERLNHYVERLGVERAEALVDEHRLPPRPDRLAGDVGNTARQRHRQAERSEKSLATREGCHAPAFVGVGMVDDFEAGLVGCE